MSDENDPVLPRRKFLSHSLRAFAGASAPLLIAPDACNKKDEESCPETPVEKAATTRSGKRPPARQADVVIVGTGFGATVAVTTLLERNSKLDVLMLERGLWWFSPDQNLLPEEERYLSEHEQRRQYWTRPDHNDGVRYLVSILDSNRLERKTKIQPLYKHHSFDETEVLTASGVGGGSLIYLNVTIPPIKDEATNAYPIFKDWALRLAPADFVKAREWMERWRGRLNKIATEVPLPPELSANDYDEVVKAGYQYLGKSRALRDASQVKGDWTLRQGWSPVDLSIEELSKSGAGCTRQGRCFLGCLPGAIQTLDRTLLRRLLINKTQYPNLKLDSLTEVSHIEFIRQSGVYHLHCRNLHNGESFTVSAKRVIVAAGTLGSTEILLRSRDCGALQLSPALGSRFSGNGDLGGFIVDIGKNPNAAKQLNYRVYPTRGPMITSHVQYEANGGADGSLQMTIEDGGVPPTVAALTKVLLNLLSGTPDPAKKAREVAEKLGRLFETGTLPALEPIIQGLPDPTRKTSYQTEHEMLEDVFYFQCMGTDKAAGQFSLNRKGKLDLQFPRNDSPLKHPLYQKLEQIMIAMAGEMGGRYMPFPPQLAIGRRRLFTLHPLGGCPLGGSATDGVVNTAGQVFDYSDAGKSSAVYPGLYVIDASIFAGPVAVNPTLTIVALALKIMEGINAISA